MGTLQWLVVISLAGVIPAKTPPNFIVILTDDQDTRLGKDGYTSEGSMAAMPRTRSLLQSGGMRFHNFFVNTPICCPSRTELITGRYYHNIGAPDGTCMHINAQKNVFTNTSVIRLLHDEGGYKTGVFGKLTNDQAHYFCPKGKPAETTGMSVVGAPCNFNDYYAKRWFIKHENGSEGIIDLPHRPDSYQTAQIGNRSLAWLSTVSPPFFLYIGPHAPHYPATPAPWYDVSPLGNLTAPRTPNYNQRASLKHQMVKQNPPLDDAVGTKINQHFKDRWTSLLSVDEIVEAVVQQVQERGLDDNTYIIYTSDHGYHLGQWTLACSKEQLYETDIRVPMYIRGPNVPRNSSVYNIGGNVDIAPTILDLAGITKPDVVDGKSLVPLIKKAQQQQSIGKVPAVVGPWHTPDVQWRDRFLVEYKSVGSYYSDHCSIWYNGPTSFGQYEKAPFSPFPHTTHRECKESDRTGHGNCWFVDSTHSNSWRALRIMNTTHNVVYAEFDPSWQFSNYSSLQHIEYYNLADDEYQMDNIARETSPATLMQLHQETSTYMKCKGVSGVKPSDCI